MTIIMDAIKKILRPIYIPIMGLYSAWFKSPRRYKYLFQNIDQIHPRNILEIGTWNGGRAIQMIEKAKKFYQAQEIAYYGFDIFEEMTDEIMKTEISKFPPTKKEVQKKIEETGAHVYLRGGNTLQSLPQAMRFLPQMDIIFIDGGHSLETIASDWMCVQKLMHQKTVVIFDDYWNDITAGAKAIVDAIDPSSYVVEVLPIVDRFKSANGELAIQFAKVTLRS